MKPSYKTSLAALAIAVPAASVSAQEAPVADQLGRFTDLEEVVVTARRTEENMQTVPVSVSSFDGEEFTEVLGAQNLTDVSIAPNVDITNGAGYSGLSGAPTIFIRGLGQSDFLAVTDPAVGVYVDGVYIARSVGSLLELTDFERIEVLRGPQGTLYGRNTEGGAINLVSRDPGEEFGGKFPSIWAATASYALRVVLMFPLMIMAQVVDSRYTTKKSTVLWMCFRPVTRTLPMV